MQTQIQYFTKDIKNLKTCNTLNHHSYNESIEILKQNPEITTTWKVSVFGFFLVCISPHSD